MAKKIAASGSVDGTLSGATDKAMSAYTSNVRVSDVVQSYGGDRAGIKQLAQDLAAIKGTKVASQERNIHRWLATESGRDLKHKRSPAKSMGDLKGLFAKKNPPTKVVIDVTGDWVDPSGNVHKGKRIATDLGQADPNVQGMLDALNDGDMMGAWNAALEGYVAGSYYQSVSSISITFE